MSDDLGFVADQNAAPAGDLGFTPDPNQPTLPQQGNTTPGNFLSDLPANAAATLMNTASNFKKYMAAGSMPATTPIPQNLKDLIASDQNVPDATVGDAGQLYAAATAPKAAGGLIDLAGTGASAAYAATIGKGLGWLNDLRNAGPAAEEALAAAKSALGTADAASTSGGAVAAGVKGTMADLTKTRNVLYNAAPDTPIPLTTGKSAAANVLTDMDYMNEYPGFEVPKGGLTQQANTIFQADTVPMDDLLKMRSQLGDTMVNGNGIEKMYAGKMWGAVTQDLQNAEQSGLIPAGSFTTPNNYARALTDLQNHPVVKKLLSSATEDLPGVIFKSGNAEDVMVGRAAMGEQGFQAAKQGYTSDLLNSPNLTKTLAKQSPEFQQSVWTPQELSTLKGTSQLLDAAKASQKTLTKMGVVGSIVGGTAISGAIEGLIFRKIFGHQ